MWLTANAVGAHIKSSNKLPNSIHWPFKKGRILFQRPICDYFEYIYHGLFSVWIDISTLNTTSCLTNYVFRRILLPKPAATICKWPQPFSGGRKYLVSYAPTIALPKMIVKKTVLTYARPLDCISQPEQHAGNNPPTFELLYVPRSQNGFSEEQCIL